jgi:hypothetical protein
MLGFQAAYTRRGINLELGEPLALDLLRILYARVSIYGQTLDVQLEQLRGADCTKIYREKVTGARAGRRELLKMLKSLSPGDVGSLPLLGQETRFGGLSLLQPGAKRRKRVLLGPRGDNRIGQYRPSILVPFAQQPGTPQPPGTPPQPPPNPTAPPPYEEPPRPIPIPRPDRPPVIDDPPRRPSS